MVDKILIYGKDTWPYTTEAREAIDKKGLKFEYFDVRYDPDKMKEMLKYSAGVRKVPVIVDHGKVTIGHKGNTWGV